MSDQEEYKNGHGREPNKKPDIGRDDVEDLIDFGDSDDEEEIEEEPEELSGSIEMQVVDEASQLSAQDDNSDEIEEVPGDLPEVLYDFDPENQGGESSLEQVVVEQQILDVAGVLIEMVEEGSEIPVIAEEQDTCDKVELESPPQGLMEIPGMGNPSNQGLKDPTESSESSGAAPSVNERREPFASGSSEIDQDGITEGRVLNDQGLDEQSSGHGLNNQDVNDGSSSLGQGSNVQDLNSQSRSCQGLEEGTSESCRCPSDQVRNDGPSRSSQSPSVDRNLNQEQSRLDQDLKGPSESDQDPSNQNRNGGTTRSGQSPVVDPNLNDTPAISGHGLKEEPSGSGQDLLDQDMGVESRSDHCALIQNLNEQQPRSSHESNAESSCIATVSNNEILINGGPSRSDKDPIEQQIREDVGACEEVMEQLELEEDEVEVNFQAHPIPEIGIERQPNMEQDIGLRDQIVEAADAVENVDLNGGPHSGPDPGEQRERVGQVAVNEEAVAPLEVVLERPADHVEADPDQNEDIVLDEQDNLVEEQAEGVQILPGPVEGEIGRQEHVAAGEPDTASEAVQKTE